MPIENEPTSTAGESTLNEASELICRRALRFATTFKWVNPRIVSSTLVENDCVARFGCPGRTVYGEVRIILDWSEREKSQIIATSDTRDAENMENIRKLLDEPVELVVVCSASDVIYHELVRWDID